MAREHALERAVLEGQLEPVALDVRPRSAPAPARPRASRRSGRGRRPRRAGGGSRSRCRRRRRACASEAARRRSRGPGRARPPTRGRSAARRGRARATSRRTRAPARGSTPSPGSRVLGVLPLESVPNFSEGRDRATIDAIGRALSGARAAARRPRRRGPQPLGVHAGRRRRRLVEALVAGVACARERIDLRRHEGAHPRIGAADVVPLVPIVPEDMERAQAAAHEVAGRSASSAAGLPLRRAGGGARRSSGAAARRSSSGGSTPASSRRTSARRSSTRRRARCSSARGRPLIAFNVNLRSDDVEVARAIAAVVRETRRRLPGRARARPRPAARRPRPGEHERRGLGGGGAARDRRADRGGGGGARRRGRRLGARRPDAGRRGGGRRRARCSGSTASTRPACSSCGSSKADSSGARPRRQVALGGAVLQDAVRGHRGRARRPRPGERRAREAGTEVVAGDRVEVRIGQRRWTVVVTGLADRRGPASVAATLYEETAESIAERERHAAERRLSRPLGADLGARPTKQARRRLDALRRGQRRGRAGARTRRVAQRPRSASPATI